MSGALTQPRVSIRGLVPQAFTSFSPSLDTDTMANPDVLIGVSVAGGLALQVHFSRGPEQKSFNVDLKIPAGRRLMTWKKLLAWTARLAETCVVHNCDGACAG